MSTPTFPDWSPQVDENARILIVGASGGIGRALVSMLRKGPACTIGAHRNSTPEPVATEDGPQTILDLQQGLHSDDDCRALVEFFSDAAGGIDGLVVLSGFIGRGEHWRDLSGEQWEQSVQANLNIPFFLARAAMERMESGTILLTGTESALHGGSPTSLPYGVSKRGTECLVQGLAREGAARGVTVNGVRMGYIKSGAHERWLGKSPEDMKKRAEMVLLKRGGEPEEAAA
ncbi:SDR family NAD(P)-dependent oxidoreductase [Salidesulfovibrio brasiliensis]|uniref:SDR family NAD(P)-dependent oxidoreductase n=1 Tax=Salidesulfovibrio brasiliensis TaxID=221711 RepID=UPI0006D24216|nr:SDR family oxidoreductase [Salidesulfovibrio brasiliensis]